LRKMHVIPLVDGVDGTIFRVLHIRVREVVSTDRGVESEAIYPVTSGIDKHCRKSVDHIACCDLLVTLLEKVF
jgi:hypothetical protein